MDDAITIEAQDLVLLLTAQALERDNVDIRYEAESEKLVIRIRYETTIQLSIEKTQSVTLYYSQH